MTQTLSMEIKKLFHNKIFWILLISLTFLTSIVGISHGLNALLTVGGFGEATVENGYYTTDNSPFAVTLYNIWIGSMVGDLLFTTLFYYILPLAAVLPFSLSLQSERDSGYLRQAVLQKGIVSYYLGKYFVTFLSGFFLAVIPLVTNLIITACLIPAYTPDPLEQLYSGQYYGGYMSHIFYVNPMLFTLLAVLIPGIFCGLWANVSLCLSLFVSNKFAVVFLPYLFLFFESSFFRVLFSNRINLELSPFYFMRGGTARGVPDLTIVLCILLVLFLGTLTIIFLRGKYDDVY